MISSHKNPSIQHIRKLLSSSKARKDSGLFVLETPRPIKDLLLAHPEWIDSVYYTALSSELETLLHKHTIPSFCVSDSVMPYLCDVKNSAGLVAVCRKPHFKLSNCLNFKTAFYLDGVSNPSNLGAILRNAAAFSLDCVFLSPSCVDPFHPESLRAMAGCFYQVPFFSITLEELLLKQPLSHLVTLDSAASQALSSLPLKPHTLFLFGSEAGIQSATIPDTSRYFIPISSEVDSLNVSVSSGIVGYFLSTHT